MTPERLLKVWHEIAPPRSAVPVIQIEDLESIIERSALPGVLRAHIEGLYKNRLSACPDVHLGVIYDKFIRYQMTQENQGYPEEARWVLAMLRLSEGARYKDDFLAASWALYEEDLDDYAMDQREGDLRAALEILAADDLVGIDKEGMVALA